PRGAAQGGNRQRHQTRSAAPLPPPTQGAQTRVRMDQQIRALLDPPRRPHQGTRRTQSRREGRCVPRLRQAGEQAMSFTAQDQEIQTLNIVRDVQVSASPDITFESVLEEIGDAGTMPDGRPFPMKIEPWPGGRWFRDLGNNTGHLWGHVQVIKPPTLLEL